MNTNIIDFSIYESANKIGVVDLSTYNPDLEVTDPKITVSAPNFSSSVIFSYVPYQVSTISTTTFGWTTAGEECGLGDGVYTINMAVNPSGYCFKVVKHLRIYNIRKEIYTMAAEAINKRDLNKSCELLNLLQNLEVAQHLVQDCNIDSYEKGIIVYNSVKTELTKYGCVNCLN